MWFYLNMFCFFSFLFFSLTLSFYHILFSFIIRKIVFILTKYTLAWQNMINVNHMHVGYFLTALVCHYCTFNLENAILFKDYFWRCIESSVIYESPELIHGWATVYHIFLLIWCWNNDMKTLKRNEYINKNAVEISKIKFSYV